MDHYSWMSEPLIWYAAYGSNVDPHRFVTYLSGGPVPGTDDVQAGARNPGPPLREEPYRFSRPIRFAHHSPRWKGATAVLDHRSSTVGALGMRYLITESQFADVVAQENRRDSVELHVSELTLDHVHRVSDRSYDGLLLLESDSGTPVVTFTCPSEPTELEPTPPSPAYLATIVRGIRAAHPLTVNDIARHLHRAPGVAPTWSIEGIEALMDESKGSSLRHTRLRTVE